MLILQSLLKHLDYDDQHFTTILVSLGQVAKLQPRVFAPKHKSVIKDFLVKELMVVDRVCANIVWARNAGALSADLLLQAENEFAENDKEWADDDTVSCEAKMKVNDLS